MATSARLLTSVPEVERERFTALAAERGVSVSHLLARLVRTAIAESPTARLQRLTPAAANDKAPAEKYTVRLMGADAATLEDRAQGRCMTASGYVAHDLRAHLRAEPPMPYKEFQELKVVTNELASIRGALLSAGGTLVLSPLTFVDFAGMDDARHASQAGEFIGSIAPHLFFSHFDPFTVRTREFAVMTGQTKESPAGDAELLMKFAEAANHASMDRCVVAWFGAMYQARAKLRADRDAMGAALFAGIDALRKRIDAEPDVAKELRTPLKDADRPRSTHALLRVLIGEMQADRSLPKKQNHAIDLLQCVVPAAYCRYVLVDAQWHARLTRAKTQMNAEGMTA